MSNHRAKHDIFLTVERDRVVSGGDPKAKFLVVRAGHEVSEQIAAKHGIVDGQIPDVAAVPVVATPNISTPRANVLSTPPRAARAARS